MKQSSQGGSSATRLLIAVIAAGLMLVMTAPLASGGGASTSETGTLALRATFRSVDHRRGDFCPAGTPSTIVCFSNDGKGIVPGLGEVSEKYLYRVDNSPAGCPAESFRVLSTTVRFAVAGKGAIDVALPGSTQCLSSSQVLAPTYPPFTITGGSGSYAGATGSGTLTQAFGYTDTGTRGTDRWVGTLVVPGVDFDVTPPTLSGAVTKTVRARRGAKSLRVTFTVTARDAVDGVVPASCQPRSGRLYKIGRTVVSCSATDTSGNTGTARFAVVVKAGR